MIPSSGHAGLGGCSQLLHGDHRLSLHRDGLLRLPPLRRRDRGLHHPQPAAVAAGRDGAGHVQRGNLLLLRAPVLRGDGHHRPQPHPPPHLRRGLPLGGAGGAGPPQRDHT